MLSSLLCLPICEAVDMQTGEGEVGKGKAKIEKVCGRRLRSSACCECLGYYFYVSWSWGKKKTVDHVWVDLNGMALEAFKGRSRLITASSQSHNEWRPGSILCFGRGWIRDKTPTLKLIFVSKFGA